jgi:TatA/E family protein of Tat protein translocase
MPNIGAPELIVILVIALIIIGPGRLPDVGAALGKSIREFRKASTDIAESTRIETNPLPPAAASTPTPPVAPPLPNVLSDPAPPVPTAPAPAPLAAPPEQATDETANRAP